MNILVTGGAGFIGSNIVDAYISKGHNVVIIDNMSTGVKDYINPKAKFYELDVCDAGISKVFDENKIDLINHHAAQIDLRKSVDDPAFDINVNIAGSVNLLQNAIKNGVKKFIFASTGGAIYGEHDYFPADEEHPTRPYAPYGINKMCVEKYLYYYNHVYGLDYVVLRYANVYGPRQNPHGECGVIAIFTDKILNGQQPLINGPGDQTRDYVFVNDVVNANVLALDAKGPVIYNVATTKETDVNYIFNRINHFAGTNFEEKHGPAKLGEQKRSVLSYEKIKKELGWTPKTEIEEGLKITTEFFKK
ncbi:MAG TPA: NAD-dependent epimerase/dehydratase family protein [Ignavibacteria bacterium]|nr:NAD-dependent epimerase/dehydratase family protein [Ignavibacteria bacterium]